MLQLLPSGSHDRISKQQQTAAISSIPSDPSAATGYPHQTPISSTRKPSLGAPRPGAPGGRRLAAAPQGTGSSATGGALASGDTDGDLAQVQVDGEDVVAALGGVAELVNERVGLEQR